MDLRLMLNTFFSVSCRLFLCTSWRHPAPRLPLHYGELLCILLECIRLCDQGKRRKVLFNVVDLNSEIGFQS